MSKLGKRCKPIAQLFSLIGLDLGTIQLMTAAADWLSGLFGKNKVDNSSASASPQEETGSITGGELDQEPVVVWEAANQMEAEVVRGRLTSAGIPAIVRSEALGAIYGLTTGTLAAAEVLVPAPLAEKALELLNSDVEWDESPDES